MKPVGREKEDIATAIVFAFDQDVVSESETSHKGTSRGCGLCTQRQGPQ